MEEPLLIPSRLSHTRLFPCSHTFSYKYIAAWLPIDWIGNLNNVLSAGPLPRSKRAWMHIDPKNYLYDGSPSVTLRQKLDEYLRSQVQTQRLNVGTINAYATLTEH